jgi:predicted dehydrogenase
LLGYGDAAQHHAHALTACPEVKWTALGVRDAARAHGLPHDVAVVDPNTLLAGGLCDAVVITTPDGLHATHAHRALSTGHHVLVEKPLSTSLADAHKLVAASGQRVLAVGYHLRHHAGHEQVRARLADLVGTVRTIDVRWAWPDPAVDGWRASGRDARWWSLAALGTHGIDLALWFAGDQVADAVAVRVPPDGIDRAAEVVLRFNHGAVAHVSVAVTHRARPSLVIVGDRGEVEATGTLGARGAGEIVVRDGRGATPLEFAPEDPYLRQLRAFAARCTGRGPHQDADAITNVELLERISPS